MSLTPTQVARLLNLSVKQVTAALRAGKIPTQYAKQYKKRWLIEDKESAVKAIGDAVLGTTQAVA